jgi:hypothetical protein
MDPTTVDPRLNPEGREPGYAYWLQKDQRGLGFVEVKDPKTQRALHAEEVRKYTYYVLEFRDGARELWKQEEYPSFAGALQKMKWLQAHDYEVAYYEGAQGSFGVKYRFLGWNRYMTTGGLHGDPSPAALRANVQHLKKQGFEVRIIEFVPTLADAQAYQQLSGWRCKNIYYY